MPYELLLEIGAEEIPAGYISPALASLEKMAIGKFAELKLQHGDIRTQATPRRLVLVVADLAECQPDSREKFMGPSKKAAFDSDNKPTKAALGFAASKGAGVEDLEIEATPKGEYVSLIKESKGEKTSTLLAAILPEIIKALPFPKSMRWGSERTTFVRPIHWFVALYGGEVISFTIGDIASGSVTRGHRFMAPAGFEVRDFGHYQEELGRQYVLVDIQERRAAVRAEVERVAAAAGGSVLEDEELLDTVTNLVELPCGVGGSFEERFLALPESVLVTAMREHQKYFCIRGADGALMPNFVAMNNTRVADEGLAAEGHQRVLRARLEDALFFFNADQARPLADRVTDLSGIIFQARLGTMQEKTERIKGLAGIFARQLAPDRLVQVDRAASLAKADLLTAMVNEFPSLQGTMGRDYALLDGEEPEVADAILEHYLPARAGDRLPAGVVGAIVSMADRLDTIVGCFGIGQVPTGTTDPFGLRRLALGLLHIVAERAFAFSLSQMVAEAISLYGGKLSEAPETVTVNVLEFIKGRFVNDLLAQGVPAEAVEAAVAVSFDDQVDCRARIDALALIKVQPSFTVLATAFKRVMNIIKNNNDSVVDTVLLRETAERELYETFLAVRDAVAPCLARKDYNQALEIILRMKDPVDNFFDDVMVMTEDIELRRNRLNLLTAIARLFLKIGDFSRMQPAG